MEGVVSPRFQIAIQQGGADDGVAGGVVLRERDIQPDLPADLHVGCQPHILDTIEHLQGLGHGVGLAVDKAQRVGKGERAGLGVQGVLRASRSTTSASCSAAVSSGACLG